MFDADADVCLGPAEDGGFWGIACRRVAVDMFEGVRGRRRTQWRDRTSLPGQRTERRAGAMVADVDEPADL